MIQNSQQRASRSHLTWCTALAIIVACAALAQAQPAPPPGDAAESSDPLRVEQRNGVSYVSGGVGEERDALERLGRDFNLRLTAAATGGKFSVPEAIRIADEKGNTLLDLAPRGPIFLAKLPAGTYTLGVTTDGATKTSKVSIPAKGQVSLSTTAAGGS
jgi:hypothetical protein